MTKFQTTLKKLELESKKFLLLHQQQQKAGSSNKTNTYEPILALYKLLSTQLEEFSEKSKHATNHTDKKSLFQKKFDAFKQKFEVIKTKIEDNKELNASFSKTSKS